MLGLIPGLGSLKTTLIMGGVIALLAGGLYAYHRWAQAELSAVRQEVAAHRLRADALEETQRVILADVAAVRAAQAAYEASVTVARTRAAESARALRNRDLRAAARVNRAELEAEANTGTADAFRGLEEASRAR